MRLFLRISTIFFLLPYIMTDAWMTWTLQPFDVTRKLVATCSTHHRIATRRTKRRRRQEAFALLATTSNSTANHASSRSSTNASSIAGRVLEGGKVIDFRAVKASEKAETALQHAKNLFVAGNSDILHYHAPMDAETRHLPHHHAGTAPSPTMMMTTTISSSSSSSILGINEAVIHEVGHELGKFADAESVQSCAAYLRSKAPPGMFIHPFLDHTDNPSSSSSFVPSNMSASKAHQLLAKAYAESGEVTGAFAKTFYMGTMLLGEEARKAIWAIYVWCRRTDEIVDAPREESTSQKNGSNNYNALLLKDLSEWEVRLENLFTYGTIVDVYDLCLLDVRIKYPTLDIQPFKDMIRGMLMDVPDLGQDRYETFDELHLYCYRVAGTVGVMSLPIFGCADGFDDEAAREPALSLGVAFQLTNILRDVGEDAVQRGRIYLPREDLRRFGVTEEQIHQQRLDDNYKTMMKFQIERARMYYARARRGVFMLAPESRLPVQASLDAYGGILDKIEENDYDSLTKRAYVDKWEKLAIIPFSWYRTLDVSRMFPLPGDTPVTDIPSLS